MEGGIAQKIIGRHVANQPLQGLAATWAVAQSQPTTKPYWFNSRQSLPPQSRMVGETFATESAAGCGLSRIGWIAHAIGVDDPEARSRAARKTCVQS